MAGRASKGSLVLAPESCLNPAATARMTGPTAGRAVRAIDCAASPARAHPRTAGRTPRRLPGKQPKRDGRWAFSAADEAVASVCSRPTLPVPGDLGCCSPPLSRPPWEHGLAFRPSPASRSEEHTSELQSRVDLVCRLLLEKKKK